MQDICNANTLSKLPRNNLSQDAIGQISIIWLIYIFTQMFMKEDDKNKDGKISFEEFKKGLFNNMCCKYGMAFFFNAAVLLEYHAWIKGTSI